MNLRVPDLKGIGSLLCGLGDLCREIQDLGYTLTAHRVSNWARTLCSFVFCKNSKGNGVLGISFATSPGLKDGREVLMGAKAGLQTAFCLARRGREGCSRTELDFRGLRGVKLVLED